MRCFRFIKPSATISPLLGVLLLASLAATVMAQSGSLRLSYDVRNEVTVSGTVLEIAATPAPGAIWGPHLILNTVSGPVDASLGRWAFQGKNTLQVSVGQQVELTGVMKTTIRKSFLLVRTVRADGKVYTMRNRHGIDVTPQARERARQKGESL